MIRLAPGRLAAAVGHGPAQRRERLAHPHLVRPDDHREGPVPALLSAHLCAPDRLNMLWKKWRRLWKTFLARVGVNMAQILTIGNSFSARIVRYSLGIGRLFG
jgi:hypothetical protein